MLVYSGFRQKSNLLTFSKLALAVFLLTLLVPFRGMAMTYGDREVTIENWDDFSPGVFSDLGTFYSLSGTPFDNNDNKVEVINFGADFVLDKPLYINCDVTLRGNGHTLDAQNKCRVIELSYGMINVTIDGFVIKNGKEGGGGGIMVNNGGQTLNVTNCTFTGNTANGVVGYGGGIYVISNATVNVANCRFENNTAGDSGGAIYALSYTNVTATNCTFTGNTAEGIGGGGICVENGSVTLTVTNCAFTGNTANGVVGYGGGMLVKNGTANVANCTFTGNTARDGGGMNVSGGTANLFHCTFTGNTDREVVVNPNGALNAFNTVFWDKAPYIILNSGVLNLYHCAYGGSQDPLYPIYGTAAEDGCVTDLDWTNRVSEDVEVEGVHHKVFPLAKDNEQDRKLIGQGLTPDGVVEALKLTSETNPTAAFVKDLLSRDQLGHTRNSVPDIGTWEYVSVEGVKLNGDTEALTVGGTAELSVDIAPEDAMDKNVKWSVTEGEDHATVDQKGVVTGQAEGKATIRATASDGSGKFGEYTVTVKNQATPPAFSLAGGKYIGAQTVTISCATKGATIYYTTNGTEPSANSTKYAGAITVSDTTTVKAIAVKSGMDNSDIAEVTYTIIPATYELSVTAPTFDDVKFGYAQPAAKTITITSTGNSPATIKSAALSGTNAGSFTLNKTGGTTIPAGETDKTYTVRPNAGLGVGTYTATLTVTYNNNAKATAKVSFKVTTNGTVATPAFTPVAGDYTGAQKVTITCATEGATIYYTTDGTPPTTGSTKYTGEIHVSATTTIKAIAVKSGMENSGVASATYNITQADYDLLVANLNFKAIVGYAQPAAKAITITNTGKNAATIKSVALDDTGKQYFTLNKTGGTTIQAGKADSSYTVRPGANLPEGTYTATLTVTYDGGRTATAEVSFKVGNASDPDDPDNPDPKPEEDETWKPAFTLETVESLIRAFFGDLDIFALSPDNATISGDRTAADLSPKQLAELSNDHSVILAVLPEITPKVTAVFVLGVSFDITPEGTLKWHGFPRPAENKVALAAGEEQCLFLSDAGEEITSVPDGGGHVNVAVKLTENVTYAPVITAETSTGPTSDKDGGGCDSGLGLAGLLVLVGLAAARKR